MSGCTVEKCSAESTAAEKLAAFRQRMAAQSIDAFIQSTSDAHQSEYVAECDKRLGFLSGFHGSAGTIVVTKKEAMLWTDGRYFAAAAKELSTDWTLMKAGLPDTPSVAQWLSRNLEAGSSVGVDPLLSSVGFYNNLYNTLKGTDVVINTVSTNPIDDIWLDQPKRPVDPVKVHHLKFAGKTVSEKLTKLREELAKEKASALVVSALDSVAWLLNLRGSDICFNPVFFAYVIVTPVSCRLYIDPLKLEPGTEEKSEGRSVEEHLREANVDVRPYADFISDLKKVSEWATATASTEDSLSSALPLKVWFSGNNCNLAIYSAIEADNRLDKDNPIEMAKALKNEAEVEGMRQCHIRDGVAKTRFLAWVRKQKSEGKLAEFTEWAFAEKLEALRREQEYFVDLSFETISSIGANGAIIHYAPTADECERIGEAIYLVDSGGQYLDGTTDVTRTVHLGTPSAHERECYTRVLKGVIKLSGVVFPENTKGPLLDSLARTSLWEAGLDYRHGTGHGVGAFLNVHEGPVGFSSSTARKALFVYGLKQGMCITIEPGYYEEGAFGIRIENTMLCIPAETKHHFGGVNFFTFESLTLIPIDTDLIDESLLCQRDRDWLNAYHKKVFETLEAHMVEDYEKDFLKQATAPI